MQHPSPPSLVSSKTSIIDFTEKPLHAIEIIELLAQNPFPTSVDSTMMSCYDSCPQKFFLEYILHLAPVGISEHLHAGGALALVMEVVRREYHHTGHTFEKALDIAFEAFLKYWGIYEPPEGSAKDIVNMWAAVLSYFEEYPIETDYIKPYTLQSGAPAVEFTFAIPTGVDHPNTGNPVLYGGRFDMLGEREDGLVVVDEKTTKTISQYWLSQWAMRGQFHGYVFGAQAHGFDCQNALVRGIGIQHTQFKHIEVPLQYSNWQIERWWYNTQQKLEGLVNRYKDMQNIIRTSQRSRCDSDQTLKDIHQIWDYSYGDACGSYGGCQFLTMCTHHQAWEWYTDFDRRFWNPIAKNPAEGSISKQAKMSSTRLAEFL